MPPYVPEFPTSNPNYMYDPITGETVPIPMEAPPAQAPFTQGPMPPMDTAGPSSPRTADSILDDIRWMVANQVVPARQNALLAALMGFQRMANASPQAILQQTSPQAGQLISRARQAQRQAGRALGPYGGGQAERTQEQIGSALTPQLAQLFARVPLAGQQGLMGIANGTSTMMPAGTRTGTGVSTAPGPNPMETAYGLSFIGNMLAPAVPLLKSAMTPAPIDYMASPWGTTFPT